MVGNLQPCILVYFLAPFYAGSNHSIEESNRDADPPHTRLLCIVVHYASGNTYGRVDLWKSCMLVNVLQQAPKQSGVANLLREAL